MQLRAVVRRDDVIGLLQEVTPLRVELSRRPQRAISIGRPTELEFVPGAGLRIRGDARISWDIVGMTVPVTARTIELLLVPKLELHEGRYVLSLDPRLEELDLEVVPFFVDSKISGAVRAAIDKKRSKLRWDLGRLLQWDLTDRVSPPTRLELGIRNASIVVDEDSLVIDLSFEPHGIQRAPLLRAVGDRDVASRR